MDKSLFLLLLLVSFQVFSQSPKLTGSINISVKTGVIDADFKLENIPKIKNYLIYLNTGFNIQYFRNDANTQNFATLKEYNPDLTDESFGYYLPDNTGKAKFLPSALRFKYTGKFPVISDDKKASERGDWKGNIAFNGKTIRADGLQTAWYPVLYDVDADKKYHAIAHDIVVLCDDCRSIYVNGSKPVSSQEGRFKRDDAVELTLFAGDYDFVEEGGSFYLNAGLSTSELKTLGKISSDFKGYYKGKLSLPYGENVVFIHTTPVSLEDAWLFVSFPSIVNISHKNGFKELFDDEKKSWFKKFLAHELAHYYFGTYRKFNSELGDMFTESFAEYLSIKLSRDLIGEQAYAKSLESKLAKVREKTFPSMQSVKSNADYGNRNLYVYTYAPLLWLALEQELGDDVMWRWMNKLLTTKTEMTDYDFMLNTLGLVVKDDMKLKSMVDKYFSNPKAIDNAKSLLID